MATELAFYFYLGLTNYPVEKTFHNSYLHFSPYSLLIFAGQDQVGFGHSSTVLPQGKNLSSL